MKNKISTPKKEVPMVTIYFNEFLDKLTVKEYKEKVALLKSKLGWSDQLFWQKKAGTVNLNLSDQIAIESILNKKIF